jgi:multiple sugar transport system permease protein
MSGKRSNVLIRRNRITAGLFLLPNIIGFLIFTLIPVIYALVLSFMQWDGTKSMKFVGFKNFIRLFQDSGFLESLKNTIIYTIGTVPFIMMIALCLSVLLSSGLKAASVWRAFHFFPHISSIVAIAVVWQFLYNGTQGPINKFLMSLGISNPPQWLSSAKWALPAVMIMIIWKGVGYYMIIYLAGLKGIPRELYEASTVDGANRIQQFRYITIPMLKSVNFYIAIMCIINSFQVFTPIYIMTGGGPGRATNVLVFQIYKEAFVNFNIGYASAVSMVLFLCVFVVTLIQFKYQQESD